MYQRILQDPGGTQLVRVISDVVVVNGSVLMVPAGCIAFFVCNGEISEPYTHGAWTVNTGLSPFFVRLRNLMTRGKPPLSVSVFFINTQRENFFRMGTGEVLFSEKKHNLSMRALASISLRFSIYKPLLFLQQLVGMHVEAFDQEDLDLAFASLLNTTVKAELANYLNQCEHVTAIHCSLVSLSRQMTNALSAEFSRFGIGLSVCNVEGINLAEEDLRNLRNLEVQRAEGSVRTAVERENVQAVYGGIQNRTATEMLTGTNRTPQAPGQTPPPPPPAAAGGLNSLLPFLLLPNLAPMFQRPLQEMMQQVNLFDQGGQTGASHSDPQDNAGPPPLPRSTTQHKTICHHCGRLVQTGSLRCPNCGRSLS